MNKIFKISIATVLSSFLLVGCSGTPDAPDSAPMSSVEMNAAEMHAHYTQKKLGAIIKKAGEDAGWKMTEFKENAFVAEKTEGDKTISTTIKFTKESVNLDPENEDLSVALKKALGE